MRQIHTVNRLDGLTIYRDKEKHLTICGQRMGDSIPCRNPKISISFENNSNKFHQMIVNIFGSIIQLLLVYIYTFQSTHSYM